MTSNYTYDQIYELTQVTQGTNTTESYTYDPVGNRTSSLGVSLYNYNNANELTSTPNVSYTYDNNGSVTSKADSTGTTTYAWDFENRLAGVTLPGSGGTVTFKYDPFGRRIYKSSPQGTSIYAYDGNNQIEEANSSGAAVARYVQTQNVDEPLEVLRSGATNFYNVDALGSITSLATSAAALAQTYRLDSFGKTTASSGSVTNPFRYTGRDFDSEANVYYNRARYYDPSLGRFLSEDPTGFRAGVDFYVYVVDNPMNLSDPTGLRPSKWASYLDCLQGCLNDTLNCNLRKLEKNLKQIAAAGPVVGVGTCGMLTGFELALAPAFLPCVGVVTVSTWAVGGAASAGAWNIRNVSSTVGCTTFCALNSW